MTAVCCSMCFDTIAKKNTCAAKLWLDVCTYCVQLEGIFKLRETRVPNSIKHFRVLEEMGYITTVDGPDAVFVRVNGYDVLEVEDVQGGIDTFCLERETHKAQWP